MAIRTKAESRIDCGPVRCTPQYPAHTSAKARYIVSGKIGLRTTASTGGLAFASTADAGDRRINRGKTSGFSWRI